ncbi:MAG: sigma-70 family RNA polymerase sigma factor, partial [Planctomycetota bacterium]
MKTKAKTDIAKIWEQFHKNHDDYHRNLLMEYYRPIVRYAAERLHSKLPDKVELDDLISAGIFGLLDAIDAFDPSRGVKFETYCSPRIRGSILDELRDMRKVEFDRLRRDANAVSQVSLNTNYSDNNSDKDIREIDIVKDDKSQDPFIETQKRDL